MAANRPTEATAPWWRDAAIYQVYVRSFADGDGDGTGDLAGVRARLPYLVELGVDALWFTPWYLSPLADGGYDVADYRAIDPAFGTPRRGREAHRRGPGAGHPHHHRHRPQPRLRPAQLVPGGAGRRPRQPRARAVPLPRGTRQPRGDPAQRLGLRVRRHPLDPDRRRPVVPAPVRPRTARPQLGAPRGPPGARGRPALLVRAGRRRRTDRLGGPARQGPRPARLRQGHRPPPLHRPGRAPRHLPLLARHRRRRTTASSSARSGSPTPSASPATCAPTNCTPPSTSTSWPAPGTPGCCAPRSTTHSPSTPRSAPPPPGCCATTT